MTPRFFFFEYTLLTLVMLIVGGRNSVSGALLGVVVITAGREFTRRVATDGYELFGFGLDGAPADWLFREGLPTIFLGIAMLGFMILRPNGLLDDWEVDRWAFRRFRGDRPEPARPEPRSHDRASTITTEDLTVDFGGFRALDSAGVTASSGEIVGLIGPNGAGKTTLVNVITGLVEPTAGTVRLDDDDLTRQPSHQIARAGLVRTFQNLRLFSALTVRENVEAAALANDPGSSPATDTEACTSTDGTSTDRDTELGVGATVDAMISAVGLWSLRDRRAGELDYGNSRRLELARAAAAGPRFLLLDEPTSGMSDAESLEMIEQVRAVATLVDAGVLVIDHDLNFITGISDRIYVLDRGRVIAHGTPAEVQADPLVQAAYLGSSANA
ncbi:MAG: ATP-binding cassette domain-containing protein [Acidimicrobiales bacterium]